jgi:glycosyltransferase involved in cell wall biosynthesis
LHPGADSEKSSSFKKRIITFLRTKCYGSIIVHGEKLKQQFQNRYHKRRCKNIHVVQHGALFSFIPNCETANKTVEEECHSVLLFGRMHEYKGLHYLIKAEPIVTSKLKNFKVIIAGKGEALDTRMNELTNNPHFEVHGRYIPNDEVATFFRRAAAVVLPYIEASQSGIAAMAFAFGKPVIASDVGSIREVVINGINGMIVPARNVEQLANAIVTVLHDSSIRRKLNRGVLKTAMTNLSWFSVAERTEAAYLTKLGTKAMHV